MQNSDGGFGSSGWQIREHDSYDQSALECGGHVEVDQALAWLDLFLNRNPLAFPLLHPASEIRVAKTKVRITGEKCFPAYKLLFTADEEEKIVTKLHVSYCEIDELSYGDPWGDEP